MIRVLAAYGVVELQDSGRPGYRSFGVPPSGAFDREAAVLANALVGNDAFAPIIELSNAHLELEFGAAAMIALTGARSAAEMDSAEARWQEGVPVRAGTRLVVPAPAKGWRAYLSIAGGWLGNAILGSCSGHRVLAGADLKVGDPKQSFPLFEWTESAPAEPIRLVAGPYRHLFDLEAFCRAEYSASHLMSRTGIRLDGPKIRGSVAILSEPLTPGCIEITPDGTPIIIGPDGPTIGGYPCIASVIEPDMDRVAQWRPTDRVRFVLVSSNEADNALASYRRRLARLIDRT